MPSPQWSAAAERAAASVDEVPHWPPPITERPPTEIDADRNHQVQVITTEGWQLAHWADVAAWSNGGTGGWQHTPIWQLRREPNESALELLNRLVLAVGCRQPITHEIRELVGGLREVLEGRK